MGLSLCCNQSCSTLKAGQKAFQVCGKCRLVRYCSRECQIADWPVHKKVCVLEITAPKLLKNFLTSEVLRTHLQFLCASHLDLTLESDPRKIYHIAVYLAVAPADLNLRQTVFDGEQPELKGIDGALTILGAWEAPPNQLHESAMKMYMEERQVQDNEGRFQDPGILVWITFDKKQSLVVPTPIPRVVIEEVCAGPEYMHTRVWKTVAAPGISLSPTNALNVMNAYMANESGNKLKLHAKMAQNDVKQLYEAIEKNKRTR